MYQTWSAEAHRLGDEIKLKLIAIQKFEQSKKIVDEKVNL